MAEDRARHPGNAAGPWFVDEACFDCDVVRQVAPKLFDRVQRQSVVARQPTTPEDEERMWLAALACPTNSVRRDPPRPRPRGLYPVELGADIWFTGHNARESFGANAFLIERSWGRAMIDAPSWHPDVAAWCEARGGLDHILLTHRDDVADADRYAERFGARVWIHHDDRDAALWATDVVSGLDTVEVEDGLTVVPIPGHTRGSVAFALEDEALFSGDSLYWSRNRQDLAIHTAATWFSLEVQLESLARLNQTVQFAWVLAGHGDRHRTSTTDMHERLERLLARHG